MSMQFLTWIRPELSTRKCIPYKMSVTEMILTIGCAN